MPPAPRHRSGAARSGGGRGHRRYAQVPHWLVRLDLAPVGVPDNGGTGPRDEDGERNQPVGVGRAELRRVGEREAGEETGHRVTELGSHRLLAAVVAKARPRLLRSVGDLDPVEEEPLPELGCDGVVLVNDARCAGEDAKSGPPNEGGGRRRHRQGASRSRRRFRARQPTRLPEPHDASRGSSRSP